MFPYQWNSKLESVSMSRLVFMARPAKLSAKHSGCLRLTSPFSNQALLLCVQTSRRVWLMSMSALRADIAQGMADVNAGRVEKMDMTSIKTQGRALKKLS